jgi:hypothetical protein
MTGAHNWTAPFWELARSELVRRVVGLNAPGGNRFSGLVGGLISSLLCASSMASCISTASAFWRIASAVVAARASSRAAVHRVRAFRTAPSTASSECNCAHVLDRCSANCLACSAPALKESQESCDVNGLSEPKLVYNARIPSIERTYICRRGEILEVFDHSAVFAACSRVKAGVPHASVLVALRRSYRCPRLTHVNRATWLALLAYNCLGGRITLRHQHAHLERAHGSTAGHCEAVRNNTSRLAQCKPLSLLRKRIPRCQRTRGQPLVTCSVADAQPTGDWCNRRSNLRKHELHCRLQQNEAAGSQSTHSNVKKHIV